MKQQKQLFLIKRITTITETWEEELDVPIVDLSIVANRVGNTHKVTEIGYSLETSGPQHHFHVITNAESI